MKVLMIATDNHSTSGAFLSMAKLCELLRDRHGVETLVVLPSRGPGARILDATGISHVTIRSFPWICRCGFVGQLERLIKILLLPVLNFKAAKRISWLLRDGAFDLVHVNTSCSGVGAAAAKRVGVPVVWHVRELLEEGLGRRFCRRRASLRLMSAASRVIAISRAVADKYEKRFGLRNVRVVMNGIDERDFPARDAQKPANRPIRIFYGGGYEPEKGFSDLVAALADILRRRGSVFRLSVAGALPPWRRKELTDAGLSPVLSEMGILDADGVSAALRDADASCISSRSEAFGRKTVEAMMSGTLVIATDSGGTPEIAKDGETACLYAPGDVQCLVRHIEHLIDGPSRMREIARRGCAFAREHLTASANADAVFRLYREILDERKGEP